MNVLDRASRRPDAFIDHQPWWNQPRAALITGITAAALLLGAFHAVVAGAVDRKVVREAASRAGIVTAVAANAVH